MAPAEAARHILAGLLAGLLAGIAQAQHILGKGLSMFIFLVCISQLMVLVPVHRHLPTLACRCRRLATFTYNGTGRRCSNLLKFS
jgi:hypothetical protein